MTAGRNTPSKWGTKRKAAAEADSAESCWGQRGRDGDKNIETLDELTSNQKERTQETFLGKEILKRSPAVKPPHLLAFHFGVFALYVLGSV